MPNPNKVLLAQSMRWMAREQLSETEFFARYKEKREALLVYRRNYMAKEREKNPEHHRSLLRASYKRHAEKRRAEARKKRQLQSQDPVAIERDREWRRARMAERTKTDVGFVLRRRIRTRIFMALGRTKIDAKKSAGTLELLGCTIDELKSHLESQFKPGMTWENRGRKGWHIDHIKPCASFDLRDPEQQRQCFHYTNLQPLWWWENLAKGDR